MINEALKENNEAVIDEQIRLADPMYEKRIQKQAYYQERVKFNKQLQEQWSKHGDLAAYLNPDDQGYLFESAAQAQRSGIWAKPKSQKDKNQTFGWDVFNDSSLYRAYTKRTQKIERDLKKNPDLLKNMTAEEKKQRMADEVEEQIAKRGQFSRRRMFVEDKDVDYVNERNRRFNEKLERNYSKYAAEIKRNLERGTAL